MASISRRGNKWQVRINHPLLPRALFATLDSESGARAYASGIESMLDRGIVPAELLEEPRRMGAKLSAVIDAYCATVDVAPSDVGMLAVLRRDLGDTRTTDITARWADAWVRVMKMEKHLAPGTVRKHVGSLARVLDWQIRRSLKEGESAPANPLRIMPRGYSQYTILEASELATTGKAAKRDVQRDRRLLPDEHERCVQALAGVKRPDRERPLPVDPAFELLFTLILNTGLRLAEAYRLRVDQIDAAKGVIKVEGSKGERGRIKPRVVPLVPDLRPVLAEWCKGRVGLVFPFWDGSEESRKRASARLGARFRVLFDYAKVPDMTEHDLRHEATCRWVMMRDKSGRWMWSEVEVCKIMGWTDTKMMVRYASLRGEDFADRMMG